MIYTIVESLLVKTLELMLNMRIMQLGMYVLILDVIGQRRRIARKVNKYVKLFNRWISKGM